MLTKNSSDFERGIDRIKTSLRTLQSTLDPMMNTSFMFPEDLPFMNVWVQDRCMKNILSSFCSRLEGNSNYNLRSQDLEQYKSSCTPCKIEYDYEVGGDDHMQQTLKKSHPSSSLEQNSQSNMEDYVSNDSSYTSNESMMSGIKKEYKRGPYKNYTVEQKQAAVKMLLEGKCSVIEISRKLQIPCKNIKRWSQQGVQRKKGGGRKRFSPETEKSVAQYLRTNFKPGSEIQYQVIQNIAKNYSTDQTFKASRGWVVKFVDRQHLRHYYKFA